MIPKVWQGELMEKDEGAFYLQSLLVDLEAQSRRGSFSFQIRGKRREIIYSLQADTGTSKDAPDTVWKVKEDEYELLNLTLIDDSGKKWEWRGPHRNSFQVQTKKLSYWGSWYLVQIKGGQQLKMLSKAGPSKYPKDKTHGAFQAIIDGISGRQLVELDIQAPVKNAEIRHVMRSTRTIGMFYSLNLFRQNAHAPAMVQVIQANDPDIRSCYTDLLERTPDVQGKLTYTFIYSSQSHSIKSLKVKQSDLRDGKFMECMMYKLMGLSFVINQSLIGELGFSFQLGEG